MNLCEVLAPEPEYVVKKGDGPIGELLGVEKERVARAFEGIEPSFDVVEAGENVVVVWSVARTFEISFLWEALPRCLRC